MITSHIPGATVGRRELVQRLRQIDLNLKEGVVSPEVGRIYRSHYEPIKDHQRFERQLKQFAGATLGDIDDRCEKRKAELDRAGVKWNYNGNRKVAAGIVGGVAILIGGIATAVCLPNSAGVLVGLAGMATGGVTAGYWMNRGIEGSYWFTDKKARVETFQKHLSRWGTELTAPLPAAPAAPAPVTLRPTAQPPVDPHGPIIDSLSPEEKRKLAQQLIDRAKAEENRKPPTVEVGADTVKVDGVRVPVRK